MLNYKKYISRSMLFASATERWPSLNGALKLVALPDDAFRTNLLTLLVISV